MIETQPAREVKVLDELPITMAIERGDIDGFRALIFKPAAKGKGREPDPRAAELVFAVFGVSSNEPLPAPLLLGQKKILAETRFISKATNQPIQQ